MRNNAIKHNLYLFIAIVETKYFCHCFSYTTPPETLHTWDCCYYKPAIVNTLLNSVNWRTTLLMLSCCWPVACSTCCSEATLLYTVHFSPMYQSDANVLLLYDLLATLGFSLTEQCLYLGHPLVGMQFVLVVEARWVHIYVKSLKLILHSIWTNIKLTL